MRDKDVMSAGYVAANFGLDASKVEGAFASGTFTTFEREGKRCAQVRDLHSWLASVGISVAHSPDVQPSRPSPSPSPDNSSPLSPEQISARKSAARQLGLDESALIDASPEADGLSIGFRARSRVAHRRETDESDNDSTRANPPSRHPLTIDVNDPEMRLALESTAKQLGVTVQSLIAAHRLITG